VFTPEQIGEVRLALGLGPRKPSEAERRSTEFDQTLSEITPRASPSGRQDGPAARNYSISTPSPSSRNTDQYLVSMATAAPTPARAPASSVREEYERRNK